MDAFADQFNGMMVETFYSILKIEEKAIKSLEKMDLTVSEMHLIEAVGKNGKNGQTISDIAEDLRITLPSVTVAIKKLAKKGYVEKKRCESDGRMVFVVLTRRGQRVDLVHKKFHENMALSVAGTFSEEEKAALITGIQRLNDFFKQKIALSEE